MMIAIGVGSNIEPRETYIIEAIRRLQEHPAIQLYDVASLYETEPVGYTEQGAFLNTIALLQSDLSPQAVLEQCLEVERLLGRVRQERWGPRTIDLDVLLYKEQEVCEAELIIPHPRMQERRFVLVPLAEVAAGQMVRGKTVAALLAATSDTNQVAVYRPQSCLKQALTVQGVQWSHG